MIVPGSKLPEFKAAACVSTEVGKEFKEITSKDYAGKWIVFYTYPKDFTFVCPTEIVAFDQKQPEFKSRNAVVLGGSTDNEHSHLGWLKSHPQLKNITHPLLFVNPAMAQAFGLLHPTAGVALRATFISDPDGVVRFVSANDLSVGRSVDEALRVLDGLQTGELCAVGWHKGEETLSQQLKKAK
jgi:lipoyl-dependent peroxiredoxin subunit C